MVLGHRAPSVVGMTTDTTARTAAQPTAAPEERVPARGPRMILRRTAPAFYEAMLALDEASAEGVDPHLAELVRMRASQLNGCGYCLDQHSLDAREKGEREHRLYALSAWRETPYFTARERAALALTEAMTLLPGGVSDEVYDAAAGQFAADELGSLIGLIVTINAWNRIGVGTRLSPPVHD
jgi:AhpD family alkylhydroperoxidase